MRGRSRSDAGGRTVWTNGFAGAGGMGRVFFRVPFGTARCKNARPVKIGCRGGWSGGMVLQVPEDRSRVFPCLFWNMRVGC